MGYLTINALFLKANELVDFYFYLILFSSMLYVHLVSHLRSLSFLLSVLSVQEQNPFIAHKQLNVNYIQVSVGKIPTSNSIKHLYVDAENT